MRDDNSVIGSSKGGSLDYAVERFQQHRHRNPDLTILVPYGYMGRTVCLYKKEVLHDRESPFMWRTSNPQFLPAEGDTIERLLPQSLNLKPAGKLACIPHAKWTSQGYQATLTFLENSSKLLTWVFHWQMWKDAFVPRRYSRLEEGLSPTMNSIAVLIALKRN